MGSKQTKNSKKSGVSPFDQLSYDPLTTPANGMPSLFSYTSFSNFDLQRSMKVQDYLEDLYDDHTGGLKYNSIEEAWDSLKQEYGTTDSKKCPSIYSMTFTNVRKAFLNILEWTQNISHVGHPLEAEGLHQAHKERHRALQKDAFRC